MKKSIGVAAVLAALSVSAAAQSSVTIYGITDVGVTYGKGSVASKWQLAQGNLQASRLGFRGTEDLGGGMRAFFNIESGINLDDGTGQASNSNNQPPATASDPTTQGLTFNRLSFVGLGSGWGEIRAGRDWTPTFTQYLRYDVGNGGGLGTSQSAISGIGAYGQPDGLRASNALEYLTPNWGGFTGHVMHAMGENLSTAGAKRHDGNYDAIRLGYVGNGLDIGLAYGDYKVSSLGDIRETILGATYDIAGVRLNGMYTKNSTGKSNDMNGWQLGITKAFGLAELRGSLSTAHTENAAGATIGDARKLTLMALYYLSKRTTLYAIAVHTDNTHGSAALPNAGVAVTSPNGSVRAMSVGIRHTF